MSDDSFDDGMNSAETRTSAPANSGCGRTALLVFLGAFGMGLALAVGFVVAGMYAVDNAVVQPMERLVKSIGIRATPEIRPDPVTIVREINNLAQLQTASIQMEKIVTAEIGGNDLLGIFEDSMIFVAVGEVTAGIDLAKMTPADIQAVTFQTVTLRLPPSEIFFSALDNELSYVADRDVGVGARLLNENTDLETQVRQAGEQAIYDAALERDILGIAQTNAQDVLSGFLTSLGFETVIFVEGDMPPLIEYDPQTPKGFILEPQE